jgi:hypothetical protein
MDYLLFGGAPSVGKTKAIIRLVDYLNSKGIAASDKPQPLFLNQNGDFYTYLDVTNSTGVNVRILISTAADTFSIIQGFKDYCNLHKPYDVIISAIRDDGDSQRTHFFSIMGITPSDFIVEIPMGKITRKNTYDKAMKWYSDTIDTLAHTILGSKPFLIS